MKKVLRKGIVIVMAALFVSVLSISASNAQGSVSLQVFYDELQPYGTWMQHGSYGYVWIPRVDRGFTPYASNGYWINTEYGNTWVSDYSWGWAPFHYGRWFYDDFYGWIWVPDTEWAPAWVAWRSGGGYYGWAPLMPGFGINVSFTYYNRLPNHYWNFVPYRYITYRTVYNHCVSRPHVVNIINNTTIITHNYTDNRRRTYFTGPTRSEMERTGRTRVDVYKVNDRSRPGRTEIDRGTASFYKPEIDNGRETRTSSMPSRYLKADQNGNREMVESRRERTNGNAERKFDNTQLRETERSPRRSELESNLPAERQPMERRLPTQREDQNAASERFERERNNMNRDQQNYNQRREQMERQSPEKPDQNLQPEKSFRRSPDQQPQRLEQMQRQSNPRSTERQEQNLRQQRDNDMRRSSEQSQRMQQIERQNQDRSQNGSRQFEQPNRNFQRQRSNETPSINRNSTQQRQPQIQRSSPQQRSNQPARSSGSENGSSRRRIQ
ncbi:MAG: hypothetical protein C0490_03205 [Marivirga sp.]|nr:hypothetical protein [Marivirga sp.]